MANDQQVEYLNIRRQYRTAAAVALAVLVIGAVFYHRVEHFNWLDSFYFCTMTLATIGYGDLVPKTDAGKLFTIFYVFIGIGIFGYFVNLFIKHAVARRGIRQSQNKSSN